MSNHLAVAAATGTLAQLLDNQLARDFAGAHAVPGRPDDAALADANPEVRVFLYHAAPDPSWRNRDLPTRSSTGQLYEKPQLGLILQYLLTFVGNESRFEPQRMLGSVARTLSSRPLLTRLDIEDMIQAAIAADPNHPLAHSDLAEQPDIIRLSPMQLSLDDLSSLWSSFFHIPYRLSLGYQASVVVLTADDTPVQALPVRRRGLDTEVILRPAIIQAAAAEGPLAQVQTGTLLEITGSQLRGSESTTVAFGGVEVAPAGDATTSNRIRVTVPAGVRAGANALRILHRRTMGDPPSLRFAGQSNVFPLVIRPQLQPLSAGAVHDVSTNPQNQQRSGRITVTLDPPVGNRQQVTLLLNTVPGNQGRAFVFEGERRDGPGDPDETMDLDLPFHGVPAGTYLIRVAVDGAETPLVTDMTSGSPTEGQYIAPVVTIS